MDMNRIILSIVAGVTALLSFPGCGAGDDALVAEASRNAALAGEGFSRSLDFVNGWLAVADKETGLIPRNLKDSNYWNAQDAAADNYPFMVITSFFTDKGLYEGRMRDMLDTEIRLTSCLGACPATYDLDTHTLCDSPIDTSNVIFGSVEYMKDGLMPITEILGKTPWSDRMISILDDIHKLVTVATDIRGEYFGNSQVIEVNGDLLQVLSRVYWMTGDEKYLDWAIEIGDYYLLGGRNPADSDRIRLRDHGCEFVLGLCELYATVNSARPEKKTQYQEPLHYLLDRILETGRNEHGMFYDEVNPSCGEVLQSHLADTWGYTLDGYYTVYEIDGTEAYRDAVCKVFGNLNAHYRGHDWEGGSMDGYADAIESALNLYNRERDEEAASWIDSEMEVLYSFQQESGIIEGWHGDGNFARTSVMYALWKTQGSYVTPWRKDVKWGAVEDGKGILLTISSDEPWSGKLCFDTHRYKDNLHLPFDWARINQFPEWFTVDSEKTYVVTVDGARSRHKGSELVSGLGVELAGGGYVKVEVSAGI